MHNRKLRKQPLMRGFPSLQPACTGKSLLIVCEVHCAILLQSPHSILYMGAVPTRSGHGSDLQQVPKQQ